MKINNKNKIVTLRASIEQLIDVLKSNIIIVGDDSGGQIKSSVKTKKNAFVRAKYLLSKLQLIETDEAKESNIEWYKTTIESLISAAEIANGELTKTMKTPIDVSDIGSSINSHIDVRQEAYDYIEEITVGATELGNILKSIDEGNMKLLNQNDFKTGIAEEHSYYNFYPDKPRKISPGYNKELDAIVISYDGTVGDVIDCYGLRIALPKAPKRASFYNARQKDHLTHWVRPKLPDGLNRDSAASFIDVIDEEFKRRDDGYWFLNNGVPEYITGANYMLLTHLKTDADGSYFHYRKAHRDLFYFLEACWVDHRCLGAILGKTRRTGATYVAIAFELTKAISIRDVKMGMTSKTDRDARAVFDRLSVMFKCLPFFFKPLNTGEGLKKELAFEMPSSRTTKNNQNRDIDYDELRTSVNYQPTTEDSYDSMTIKFYIGDEFSKWLASNILNHYSKVKKTLMKGKKIHGKAFILSTVEYITGKEYNDPDAKSGDRFKHLFYQSDPAIRNENDMTNSGLYKIFISSVDNYEGFIDMYGNCISDTPEHPIEGIDGGTIIKGVRQYLEDEWKKYANDPATLNDERRKDPITEDDMFRIASKDSMFNVMNIQDQLDYNGSQYIVNNKHGYVVGNLTYYGAENDKVKFVETPNGKFKFSWIPPESMQNKVKYIDGHLAPTYDFVGTLGVDPYKFNQVVGNRGSKGAIVGYLGNHPFDDIPKDTFFMEYNNRPQTLNIFYEDVIMACLFTGMPALIENNIPEILRVMYQRGLTKYAMRRPDKRKLTPDELMYGGIPSTDLGLIKTQAMFLEKYIQDHVGFARNSEFRDVGEMGNCPFNDLLIDWIKFDLNDRTKYDLTVASGLAIYGSQKFYLKNTQQQTAPSSTNFYSLYNNKGTTSKLI